MNRTDELTDRLIDGTLADAEALELLARLEGDPAACARHRAALRLELVLRGLRTEFDLAEPIVAKIESDRVARTTSVVMAGLAHRPAPEWDRKPRRRVMIWAVFATLAAVLVGVWLVHSSREPGPSPHPNRETPAAPDVVRVTSLSGAVEIVGPDGAVAALQDQPVTPDHTLRTVGEESVAVLEFSDRTRVEVHPDTAVRLDAGKDRKLFLVQGRVTAVATGQRIVVGAGGAEVQVSRGTFSLWSSGAGSIRVEPADGDVRLVRGQPAEPVLLGPDQTAFVRDELTPVRIEPRLRTDASPRAKLDFMALDVGVAPDGEVWAASARHWARWNPGAADPGRTLFQPKVSNDGMVAWLTPDRKAVALCRTDDREEKVTIRDLPSGRERGRIPVRVSEPRLLCVAPDASWVATAGGQKPNNRRVRLWDVDAGAARFEHELDDAVSSVAASPDGKWLAVGVSDLGRGLNNGVVVFDSDTGERVFALPTKRKGAMALAFTGDSRHLAVGFNGAVQIWDVPGRRLVRTLDGFENTVTRLAYDPHGRLLAAGTQDGRVWVWLADSGRRVQVIEAGTRGVRSLAFNADAKLLVTATNKAGVAVWDVSPEQE